MANQLVLSPNLQNIVDDVNQKNTEEITGADIAEMIEAIESKSTYVNKGFVEDQIGILNEEYLKYLKNIEDLSKRFAEKRLEILQSDQPRRPIRIVGMNQIKKPARTDEAREQAASQSQKSDPQERIIYRRPEVVDSFFPDARKEEHRNARGGRPE